VEGIRRRGVPGFVETYLGCVKDDVFTQGVKVSMAIFLKILLIIVCLGLIAVVLLQKGKSAGLSGAITGGAEHLFGRQKARGLDLFLSRLTVGLAVAFFVLSVIVAYFVRSV